MLFFAVSMLLTVAFGKQNECGENSYYHICGSGCPLTCENHLHPREECIFPCERGCHCEPGYVKAKTGKCVKPEDCPITGDSSEKNCYERPKKGVCLDTLLRWYYDSKSGECREFVYGGCEGNGNSFMTNQECMEYCSDRPEIDCYAKPEPGSCYTNMPRYYYDREDELCKPFVYRGCGGNTNNFLTIEECYWTCGWNRQD